MSDEKPIYTAENPKPYDETEFYEAEIKPLLETIKKLCKEKDIPYLAVFQTKGDSENAIIQGKISTGDETHSTAIVRAYHMLNMR